MRDSENGSQEPKLFNAALRINGGFQECIERKAA